MNTLRSIFWTLAAFLALPGSQLFLSGCAGSNTSGVACGNDWIDDGEQCDSIDLAGQTCAGLGFSGGTLACKADCTFDTSGCSHQQGSCGDGVINGTELCDGAALGGQSCRLLGFSGGTLACSPGCTFDTSGCSSAGCGDGVVSPPEVCDGADLAGQTCQSQGFTGGSLACEAGCGSFDTSGCTTCGDGVINGIEVCDGVDLAGQTCAGLGFTGGTLACAAGCGVFDTSGCTTCNSTLLRGNWNGWDYWKVPVTGVMSDNNVAAACAACGGMSVPCSGPSGCEWNGGVCVQTPNENNCGWPMQELSWWLCGGNNPDSCGALFGVYQYMGNTFISGSTCGAESGTWCAVGTSTSNRHGLCVRPAL